MQYIETLLLLCCLSYCANASVLPDTVKTGKEYLELAQQQEAQENFEQAIEYYELAKANFRKRSDNANLAYTLTKLALLYTSDSATWNKSEAYLDSAQTILQEPFPEGDTFQALLWSTKAELAIAQEEYEKAIKYYQESLRIKKALHGESHLEVARDLDKIGRIYLHNLQNPYGAEEYLQAELDIREERDSNSRQHFNIYYNLAMANWLQGDSEKALAYGISALEGYRKMKTPSYFNIVLANNLIGNIYWDFGIDSVNDALNYNREAIELAQENNLSHSVVIAPFYTNRSAYYSEIESYDSAIYYAKLAIIGQSRSDHLAKSYHLLGKAYLGKLYLDSAYRSLEKSKRLKDKIYKGQNTQLSLFHLTTGELFKSSQQYDSAFFHYKRALWNAKINQGDTVSAIYLSGQEEYDLDSIIETLLGIIDLMKKQYDQADSVKYLSQALPYFVLFDQCMDLSRTDFSTEGSKIMLLEDYKQIYEQAIAVCYKLYEENPTDSLVRQIFHFMEKSKAMVLLESIRQAERNQRILPDSLEYQYQFLQAQLAYYQSELIAAEQNTSKPPETIELQLQKAKVLREIEELNQYIQLNYPNYYSVTYQNMVIQLDSLREYVTSLHPVISYFWGDSAVYALMITLDSVKIHRIEDIDIVNDAIFQYQDAIVNDIVGDPSYKKFIQFQESAYTLYQLLLESVLPKDTIEHLTIVPDGNLTTIPFESLVTSKVKTDQNDVRYEWLPYLIKQHKISYEFSLSIAFDKKYIDVETQKKELTVAAFGIKDFGNLPKKQRYPQLGGAEREVRYVQEKFPQAQIFLNEKANETQFKRVAPKADILHIATHGIVDIDNPFTSKFIFYPSEKEDGILHLYELYNIPLKARIVMLSACESGVGKHFSGEGNFSLARSFVYAGCKSVIMSLWQVNDITTEPLVQGIYKRLVEQQSISEAMRNTKLAFIEEGSLAHPQCWAGMVPLGEVQLEPSKIHYANFRIIFMGLLLSLGTVYLFFRYMPFQT